MRGAVKRVKRKRREGARGMMDGENVVKWSGELSGDG